MAKSSYVNAGIARSYLLLKHVAKKEGGGKIDKRSVQKYMKQQEKEAEPINNAFAELLKGIKLDD